MVIKVHQVPLQGGVTLSVEDAGSGPAMLLLHAGVSERHMWDPQWAWLQESRRVLRWDWRGFGDTPHVPGPFSYAGDVLAVMDALQIDRATIAGASFGGGVAIQFAIQHPQRVDGLVLVGPGLPGFRPDPGPELLELFQKANEAFEREDAETALAVMEKVWLVGPRRDAARVDPGYLARARELLRRSDRPDNGAVSSDGDWSAMDRLDEIRVPVLLVVGGEDVPAIAATAEVFKEKLPQAEIVRMDDAAHLPNLEHPDQFNRLLRTWLEGNRPV